MRLAVGQRMRHSMRRRRRAFDVWKAHWPSARRGGELEFSISTSWRSRARLSTSSSAAPAPPNESARYEMTIVAWSFIPTSIARQAMAVGLPFVVSMKEGRMQRSWLRDTATSTVA